MILIVVLLAILAFWMSTQQSALLLRFPIWIAGAGLLLIAAFLAWQQGGHDAVIAALTDAWSKKDDPTEGVLFQALSANAPATVQRYVTPLMDLLIVFAALLGALAFIALTPGEFLERAFVRPLAMGLIGATGGAAAALAIVAVALGGPVKLKKFVGLGEAAHVYDGDTFWLGDVSLRLLDVDAPELNQICRGQDTLCGRSSKTALAQLIDGKIVECTPQENSVGRNRESLGRPLVACAVHEENGSSFDLGQRLIEIGAAVPYAYTAGAPNRYDPLRNLWRKCTLQPHVWRTDGAARNAFSHNQPVAADKLIGDCGAAG